MRFDRRRVGAILALVIVLSALLVPAASAAPSAEKSAAPAAGSPTYYWVKPGDTLYKIAARFGVSAAAIADANNIRNWNKIYVGQCLIIPRSYGPCGWNPCPPPRPPAPPPPPRPPYPCGWNPCPQPQPLPCGNGWCPGPQPGVGPWHAWYYTTTDLSGSVATEADYSALNFNWGWGPPINGMPNQNWSARYQSNQNLGAGTYRVQVTVDDGARVYINGQCVIDQWNVQSVRTFTQDVYLGGGNMNITVEYFQAQGVAELHYNMWRLY
jgi:LysM repeat protein